MSRLTRNIRNKQNYCEFEIKDCKYQFLYSFEKYSELEDYVDCDLTLAIDKLGQLEDIEEWIEKGLYVAFNSGIIYCKHIITDMKQIGIITDRDIIWFNVTNYGEKFALTEKELIK